MNDVPPDEECIARMRAHDALPAVLRDCLARCGFFYPAEWVHNEWRNAQYAGLDREAAARYVAKEILRIDLLAGEKGDRRAWPDGGAKVRTMITKPLKSF